MRGSLNGSNEVDVEAEIEERLRSVLSVGIRQKKKIFG